MYYNQIATHSYPTLPWQSLLTDSKNGLKTPRVKTRLVFKNAQKQAPEPEFLPQDHRLFTTSQTRQRLLLSTQPFFELKTTRLLTTEEICTSKAAHSLPTQPNTFVRLCGDTKFLEICQ